MAVLYSTESAQQYAVPSVMPNASYAGGRVRRYRDTITLASQTTSDTIQLQRVPPQVVFCFGILLSTVTLGSSVIAIGVTGNTGKYRTAATFTAVETPTLFGKSTSNDDDFTTAEEEAFITITTASLPASGVLVVDRYYSGI